MTILLGFGFTICYNVYRKLVYRTRQELKMLKDF